ncbi:MAG: FAD-dependent oxidoreductase [Betaproteobacteria bacterium]|nr:FAD-dependent oxidoreductase [Betaproteobacteria bacterium]
MPDSQFDVIVIGAGITGLTAAQYAAQSGLATANIEALLFGGLVININELDGEPHGSGTELASNLMMEVSDLGVANIAETVTALAREGDLLSVATDAGRHRARAVIIASGAQLRRLGIPGEAEFEHKGVSQCADCDGPMYKDEDVVVVGGGDSALQEALVLANFCKRVHVVHRGTKFRARRHLVDAVTARNNIQPLWNTVAEEVLGTEMVTRVRVRNVLDGATTEIPCTGLFAYIGLEPRCEFAPPEIQRDANGGLMTDASLQTAMIGVYAAGAVRAGYGGLLTHAVAEGDAAARALTAHLRG